jgi:hypothetical protein
VKHELDRFGKNPAGLPIYRLVWSENKLTPLDDELIQEYDYDPPRWVIEKWLPPEMYAGSEILYAFRQATGGVRQGPYPRAGYYVEVSPNPFVPGVPLSAEVVALVCTLIERGRAFTGAERIAALKEREARKEEARKRDLVEQVKEAQTSASEGRLQQAVSGPKVNHRTVEDYERDQKLTTRDVVLPAKGITQY